MYYAGINVDHNSNKQLQGETQNFSRKFSRKSTSNIFSKNCGSKYAYKKRQKKSIECYVGDFTIEIIVVAMVMIIQNTPNRKTAA